MSGSGTAVRDLEPPSPALPAATVVVVREAQGRGSSEAAPDPAVAGEAPPPGAGFEVLFLCRHSTMGFMGGAHVFPGGKLDPSDCDPAAQAVIPADLASRVAAALEPSPGRTLTPEQALGLYVAGCRELFEEAGVLLASPEPAASVLRELLAVLAEQPKAFLPALAERGMRPAVESLRYVSHWITPSTEPRRFDTRFFLAQLPRGQEAWCDPRESSALVWLSPAEALRRHAAREIVLPPPTLRTVEALARPGALDPATADGSPAAVQPKMVAEGESLAVVLPWDPGYAQAPGEGWPLPRPPLRMVAGPSRIALEDGVWRSR